MTLRRLSGAALALAVITAIVTRLVLNMEANGWGLAQALWSIYRYFTLWTITLIAGVGLMLALGRPVDARISGGLVLAVTLVGIVYHTLLAGNNDYTGTEWLVDQTFHTLVPLWFPVHWLVFEPKLRLGLGDIPLWLTYPAIYCAYALIRAQVDGTYPYPFLDISEKGLGQVVINMVGLLIAFALAGALIVITARLMSRNAPAESPIS